MRWNFTWKLSCLLTLLIAGFSKAQAQYDLVVAQDGSGNFMTVQAAINAAPTGRTTPYRIFIHNGTYRETVNIPSSKPFIQLIGESVAGTVITFNNAASTPLSGGGTIGTFNSATVIVNASDFMAMNITFQNSFGDGSQAVAIQVNGDRAAFKNCRFLGNQDTLLTNGTTGQRQYFRDCYIDGNVDFIFGSAKAVFDSCVIYAKTRTSTKSSFITAANTPPGQSYGYVLRNCKIPSNTGGTFYFLGRPWQNETGSSPLANNKVVYLNATLPYTIQPAGWTVWDAGTDTTLILFAEYQSKGWDGNPTDVSQRVTWSRQLTDADTANFSVSNVFSGWDPCSASPDFCSFQQPEVVVSNLKAAKVSGQTSLTWNASWPIAGAKYELFRDPGTGVFAKIGEADAANDTAVNFNLTDTLPPPGSIYTYYIQASAPGALGEVTDTAQVSSKPTILVSGAPGSFLQGLGTASASQTYSVSGSNLTASIVVTPPAPFEISADKGQTWINSTGSITLTQNGGVINNDSIGVRLNAATAGSYAGAVIHASTGADTVNLPLKGTTQSTPLTLSSVLMHWPMTSSAGDNPAERSADLTADTPAFNRLTLSNGTTVATVPAFSTNFGEAFGASTNGDGTWTTAVGGPGGSLNRSVYEQYLIKPSGTDSVRVDSLILTSSFFNTSSNTKLAVVYSFSGFASDSANVSGGLGPGGAALAPTANGGFTTPIALPNETSSTTANYRLALAGGTGVTIAPGKALTIRLYFSCGSSSAGRYAKVKDVFIKGGAKAPPVNPSLALQGTLGSFFQDLGIPSDARGYTLTGANLDSSVTVLAPAGYEISPDAGVTWYNSSNPLVLTPDSNGNLNAPLAARLNTISTGSSSGNILHITKGVDTLAQAVTGITVSNATRQIAFPGAEGFGRFSQGGRGGSVYQVTNLNDAGPGSLRDAVSQPNRTIVFRISGTIVLQSTLKIVNDNLTIAGQTAPGGGICVSGFTVTIAANNIIIRYMRFRLGDLTDDIDDACNAFKSSNHDIILDHCSMSWSVDETGTFYDVQQFTLQWSILSESLYHSVDPKGNHGYAGIWGGQGTTFHHNLLADHSSRNPRFSGSRYLGPTISGTVDMRNNVIYNWGNINSSYGGEGGLQNMINNYYKPGPATPGSLTVSSINNKRNRILNYTSFYFASDAFVYPDTLFGGKFFIDGNFVEGFPDVSADNWTLGVQPDDYPKADSLIAAARQTVPFPYAPVNTQSATDAYVSVLNNAGAILPFRDTVDRRILREARTGTADFEGAGYAGVNAPGITHPSGIIDSQDEVGGWPSLVTTAALPDSDQDGMPDYWELRRGLNPLDPTDRNSVNVNGYTNLENYLNGDSITAPGIPGTCVTASLATLSGSGSWVHARDTASSLLIPTDTLNLVASFLDKGPFAGSLQVSYYTTPNTRFLPNTRPYLGRNFNIQPTGATGGSAGGATGSLASPLTVRVYISQAELNALEAVDTSVKSISDLAVLQVDSNACFSALPGAYTVIQPSGSGVFGTYANGYYIEFQISSFGSFFLAGAASAAIPPFAINSFNAVAGNNQVKTNWTVNNLNGVNRFIVERGSDTASFQAIGTVATADSTGHLSYGFNDMSPMGHTAFYRLEAVLNDSVQVFSQPVEVGTNLILIAFPNPDPLRTITVLYPGLVLQKGSSGGTLQLFSTQGVLLRTYPVAAGSLETTVDISGLARGTYILVLNSNNRIGTVSFIKL
jgi:pectinesterase